MKEKTKTQLKAKLTRSKPEAAPAAPETKASATRGYYGFSADYPGERRANGVFFQTDKKRTLSRRGKWIVAVAAVLVFLLCYTAATVCLRLSARRPGAVGNAQIVDEADEFVTAAPESLTRSAG